MRLAAGTPATSSRQLCSRNSFGLYQAVTMEQITGLQHKHTNNRSASFSNITSGKKTLLDNLDMNLFDDKLCHIMNEISGLVLNPSPVPTS
jgi:hypothetical protein